jgi:hypothetical protein
MIDVLVLAIYCPIVTGEQAMKTIGLFRDRRYMPQEVRQNKRILLISADCSIVVPPFSVTANLVPFVPFNWMSAATLENHHKASSVWLPIRRTQEFSSEMFPADEKIASKHAPRCSVEA